MTEKTSKKELEKDRLQEDTGMALRPVKWDRAWPLVDLGQRAEKLQRYEGVEEYDPVLRAHCRL
jgi:hypothetical protein